MKLLSDREETWPDDVEMRLLTGGGAVVEVYRLTFPAKFSHKGAPYALEGPGFDINGHNWRCLGCGKKGREENEFYHESGFRKLDEARDGAQKHAKKECTAIPRPADR